LLSALIRPGFGEWILNLLESLAFGPKQQTIRISAKMARFDPLLVIGSLLDRGNLACFVDLLSPTVSDIAMVTEILNVMIAVFNNLVSLATNVQVQVRMASILENLV
jgi:hypothetical protein